MPSIVVRAPATSANLGAGFDSLGLALDLWNEVCATPGSLVSDDGQNLILRAARVVYEAVDAPYPGFELRCTNRIIFNRGLGSSAAAIASGLLFANCSLGEPLGVSQLLELAVDLEGHPDNVAPCLLGGVRVALRAEDGRVIHSRVPVSIPLAAVCFIPDQHVPTPHARGLLPATVPLADAVFNVGRAGLLVAALASGQPELLAEATRDRLHQPFRLPLFPAGATLLDAAMQAGAYGSFISGAGPTVMALCADSTDRVDAVVEALETTAMRLDIRGVALRLALSERGAHVVA